ncbi:hypothetical protein [Pseudomonas sp. Leaf58]|uniref:hypothetical protein n=1 Tax=Pseudomonas sp. Leaf58 TaxID=1736226 RepID=UPI00355763CA
MDMIMSMPRKVVAPCLLCLGQGGVGKTSMIQLHQFIAKASRPAFCESESTQTSTPSSTVSTRRPSTLGLT